MDGWMQSTAVADQYTECIGSRHIVWAYRTQQKKKRKEKIGQQCDTYTGKNLDVDRVWFAAGCRASVVASVGFVSVDNLQFAVRPSTVFRLDEDTFTLRLVVKQLVVVIPEDELRWDWTLQCRCSGVVMNTYKKRKYKLLKRKICIEYRIHSAMK